MQHRLTKASALIVLALAALVGCASPMCETDPIVPTGTTWVMDGECAGENGQVWLHQSFPVVEGDIPVPPIEILVAGCEAPVTTTDCDVTSFRSECVDGDGPVFGTVTMRSPTEARFEVTTFFGSCSVRYQAR